MRVLIVDDSVVFRSQIKAALEGAALIEVVGTANNGKIALQKLAQASVDLVTLDMEMPEMGGLETIKEIRKAKYPVRIIVFSSHTTRGSEMALEALALGADDLVAKPASIDTDIAGARDKIRAELLPKISQFIDRRKVEAVSPVPSPLKPSLTSTDQTYSKKDLGSFLPSIIVIGSSTGGPPALEKITAGLKAPIRVPILIAQHMPPVFTASLAKRLESLTGIPSAEGVHDEELSSNRIYVAPGNFHMTVKKSLGGKPKICLDQGPPRNSVRPAVDCLFESVSEVFGTKCMGLVLTGMGEDGMLGARAIKSAGGGIVIQDKMSCVVFGMPGAVFQSGAFDEICNTSAINQILRRMTN